MQIAFTSLCDRGRTWLGEPAMAVEAEAAMRGVITKRDVLENMGLIWREFGPRCLLRCLGAMFGGRTTFLDIALRTSRR